MSIKTYIENKDQNHFVYYGVEVLIRDNPENINVKNVIKMAKSRIPSRLLNNFRKIKIGKFKELESRNIQAMYDEKEKCIYLTSNQQNEEDMLDDLIHEIAHSLEYQYKEFLYGDKEIKSEFLEKRKRMWMKLRNREIEASLEDFLDTSFSPQFDNYLYRTLGYNTISVLFSDLFYSPYASTSVREYFANGFEAFFMREDIDRLKNISPKLYRKIAGLMEV